MYAHTDTPHPTVFSSLIIFDALLCFPQFDLPVLLNAHYSKFKHTHHIHKHKHTLKPHSQGPIEHQTKKMSPPPLSLSLSFLFLLFAPSLLLAQSQPPSPPSATTPPSSYTACKSTLYPKLCRSILSAIRSSPSDPYGFGKFSIKQSLKQARKLSKVFEDFLQRHKSSSSLNRAEISALYDCRDLNQLNVGYLESINDELKTADSSDAELVEKIESYLSAVATNHYTCFDGLVVTKSSIGNALAVPLKDVTELYSVSLGLVTEALSRNLKKHKTRKHGLPTKAFKVRQPLEKLIQVINISRTGGDHLS